MKNLSLALALVLFGGAALAQSDDPGSVAAFNEFTAWCKTTPLGQMTREQVGNCQMVERMVTKFREMERTAAQQPDDAVRVQRGASETIERPPARR